MSDAVEVTIASTDPLILDQMWALGANGVFERDDEVVVGFDNEATAQQAIAQLPERIGWTLAPSPPLETWDTYSSVVTDGRFVIHPPWLPVSHPTSAATKAGTGRAEPIFLTIDPGASFGHGGHPTTLLALRSLAQQVRPGDSVLDVGSGSGVLAIAAAKLGATQILATDIDPAAVAATSANARRNGVTIESTDTRLHDIARRSGTYDVVVANMERPTLTTHLEELWQVTGRTLILSGVLADDPLDLHPLKPVNLTVEQHDEWAATTLIR